MGNGYCPKNGGAIKVNPEFKLSYDYGWKYKERQNRPWHIRIIVEPFQAKTYRPPLLFLVLFLTSVGEPLFFVHKPTTTPLSWCSSCEKTYKKCFTLFALKKKSKYPLCRVGFPHIECKFKTNNNSYPLFIYVYTIIYIYIM